MCRCQTRIHCATPVVQSSSRQIRPRVITSAALARRMSTRCSNMPRNTLISVRCLLARTLRSRQSCPSCNRCVDITGVALTAAVDARVQQRTAFNSGPRSQRAPQACDDLKLHGFVCLRVSARCWASRVVDCTLDLVTDANPCVTAVVGDGGTDPRRDRCVQIRVVFGDPAENDGWGPNLQGRLLYKDTLYQMFCQSVEFADIIEGNQKVR